MWPKSRLARRRDLEISAGKVAPQRGRLGGTGGRHLPNLGAHPTQCPSRLEGWWAQEMAPRPWLAGGQGGSPCLVLAAARLVSCLWGAEAPVQHDRGTNQKVIFPRSFNFRKLTQCDSCPILKVLASEINCIHFPPPPLPFSLSHLPLPSLLLFPLLLLLCA